mmetsp:Transcript_14949/g.43131  ORF Transcript_14949/g.43131 Transcript_14949/m.43131 type:complete len:296 (+) Transcript_14949:448-1335(+)
MEQRNALLALRAVAHLDPSPPMVLPAPLRMQPVEAHLAEEVLALVAEQNGVLLITLDADLHLLHSFRLLLAHLLELSDDVAVALHQVPEVADVRHPALLLHRIGVVAQGPLEDVNEVGLVLDVDAEDALHFEHILDGLDQRVLAAFLNFLLNFPCEDVRQEVLDPELHDGLPVRNRLLQSRSLQHLPVLVVIRVLPCGLICGGVDPVDSAFADVLEKVRGLGLTAKRFADPQVILVCRRIEAQVPHVFLQSRGLAVGAVQYAVDDRFVVGALLQGDLHLVPRHSECAPWPLVEDA